MAGESKLEKAAVREAKARGVGYARKVKAVNRKGFPDHIFCYKGLVMFCEFKNPNGTGVLNQQQRYEQNLLINAGAVVVNVDTMHGFIECIEKFKHFADTIDRLLAHVKVDDVLEGPKYETP
jgi:hypothetical protein